MKETLWYIIKYLESHSALFCKFSFSVSCSLDASVVGHNKKSGGWQRFCAVLVLER